MDRRTQRHLRGLRIDGALAVATLEGPFVAGDPVFEVGCHIFPPTSVLMDGRPMGSAWAEPLFEAIFSEHYARVVAVLGRLLGDHAEAEEAAMDVFCKLYEQPLPQERGHNLGGWLYRTATRLGIDRLRAANRRKQYEQAAGLDLAEASAPPDPLQEALREETCRQVRAALARLKPSQAQLLLLRSSGLSYKELADALGVKATSIGTLLARAEAEFEKCYDRDNV